MVAVKVSKNVNQLTSEEKSELKALSQEVFGASSRWQKLVDRGYTELVTETTTEFVPGEKEGDEGTTREVQVPVKTANGAHQYVTKRHTVDSIRDYMLERKAKLDEIRAEIKRQQDEARAKKEQEALVQKVHQELQGSAI